jgi:hypothetical protein
MKVVPNAVLDCQCELYRKRRAANMRALVSAADRGNGVAAVRVRAMAGGIADVYGGRPADALARIRARVRP